MKIGNKKSVYKITVVPLKNTDLKLSQTVLMQNHKVQLKFVSDKYDTSQIRMRVMDGDMIHVNSTGKYDGKGSPTIQRIYFGYGSYKQKIRVSIVNGIVDVYSQNSYFTDKSYTNKPLSFLNIIVTNLFQILGNKVFLLK